VSFFELPPPPPEPPEPPKQPEWIGPAENVLGAPFPLAAVLARTERVGIQVYAGLAYPNGFEFSLQLSWREERRHHTHDPIHAWHETRSGEIPAEVLRFGVEDADGGRATVFGRRPFESPDEQPTGPILMQRGGGGGMHRWDMRFWCWPLPPAGKFAFVVEWPSEAIALTRVEIDAAPIRDAASRAVELWPDGEPGSGSASSVHFLRASS
jgi:hypothetical protein